MKTKITALVSTLFCLVSCSVDGPRVVYIFKYGKVCEKMTTFNYPDGVKTKMDQFIYSMDGNLLKNTIFTQRWPNGEYHLIDEKGFVLFERGYNVFLIDSIPKPDNLIYESFDKDFNPIIEVYKNGVREPFEYGYEDGHQTMEFMRDPPGVYNWKDGVQYFEREFTQEEWDSHERMNEYLNSDEFKEHLPDSLRKN